MQGTCYSGHMEHATVGYKGLCKDNQGLAGMMLWAPLATSIDDISALVCTCAHAKWICKPWQGGQALLLETSPCMIREDALHASCPPWNDIIRHLHSNACELSSSINADCKPVRMHTPPCAYGNRALLIAKHWNQRASKKALPSICYKGQSRCCTCIQLVAAALSMTPSCRRRMLIDISQTT